MARPLNQYETEQIRKALSEIPSIMQTVGAVQERVRRTKRGSKLNLSLWDTREKLLSQASFLLGNASAAIAYAATSEKV